MATIHAVIGQTEAEKVAQTNLDMLNKLLKASSLALPDFRRFVSDSLHNHKWLKDKLSKTDCDLELKRLLDLDPKSLLKPYNADDAAEWVAKHNKKVQQREHQEHQEHLQRMKKDAETLNIDNV